MHGKLRYLAVGTALTASTLASQAAGGEAAGKRTTAVAEGETSMAADSQIAARMEKYALTPMRSDLSGYGEREQRLLKALLEAAGLADEIYWRQTSHIALPMREQIEAAYAEDHPLRRFYMMQAGPYDRLDHDAPFIEGVPEREPGGAFYPDDITAEEMNAWVEAHPADRESFLSPYTVIRRKGDGLVAIPYHEEYRDLVEPLAAALRRAADLARNEDFARYLRLKADAVTSDEYFDADTAWINMEGNEFDVVIGPFEVYSDELMNIKAAYEASVEIVDREESARLEIYKEHLAGMEEALPYDDRYKPESHNLTSSFTIVRDIYRGGDIRVGYQPVAANLPNDPRVHTEVGTKRTFWKNMFEARTSQVILPISRELIVEDQIDYVTPQAFFDMVLLHEIAHGLGPRYAETDGGRVPVNQALMTEYSWIEESKATIAGLVSLERLIEAGVIDAQMIDKYYGSYLGSTFRTIRFGTGEAHGQAALVELNYFLDRGGIVQEGGRYAVDFEVLPRNIKDLARDLLTIEAVGDIEAARELKLKYGKLNPELQAALDRVSDVPVDPVPVYRNSWGEGPATR
jgi:hypothetical protein